MLIQLTNLVITKKERGWILNTKLIEKSKYCIDYVVLPEFDDVKKI